MNDVTSSFDDLPDDELFRRLNNCVARTVQDFIEMARLVQLLESRGHDLSAVRFGFKHLLRKIACGQLLPDAMVKLGGTMVLDRVASLPIPDQQKVLAMVDRGEGIEIAHFENGAVESRRVPVTQMTRKQISQVFDRDHIRDQNEQVSWLRDKQQKMNCAPTIESPRVDKKRGTLVIPPHTDLMAISKTELLRYLMQMEG